MARDAAAIAIVIQYTAARVAVDHPLAARFAQVSAANGDSTQKTNITNRKRGERRPARSIKLNDPADPAISAVSDARRRRWRNGTRYDTSSGSRAALTPPPRAHRLRERRRRPRILDAA